MRRAIPLLLVAGCSLFDAAGEDTASSDSGAGEELCESGESAHAGQATYNPGIMGGGNCTYGPSADAIVAGVSDADYDGSVGCGGCLEVERSGVATILVRVVDSCIGCPDGEVVLSPEAFQMLEPDLEVGVTPITWRWVECPVEGAISIHFLCGSSDQWLAVQVRDHRHRIASLEAQVSGASSWLALDRADYNYFIADPGIGFGPLDFRITDIYGHQLIETGMEVASDVLRAGSEQFPACE